MRTRIAALLGLALVVPSSPVWAQAQPRTNTGQQLQQQLLNNLENRVLGQPNTNPNQGPNPYGQYPNQGNYQVQRPTYGPNGYQVQPGYAQPGYAQPAQLRYQLPAQYSGYAPGSTLSYGGANYVVNPDRTMSPIATNRVQPAAPAPVVQRYQIPAQYAGAAPGSTVTYGSATYTINSDRTMSPVTSQ